MEFVFLIYSLNVIFNKNQKIKQQEILKNLCINCCHNAFGVYSLYCFWGLLANCINALEELLKSSSVQSLSITEAYVLKESRVKNCECDVSNFFLDFYLNFANVVVKQRISFCCPSPSVILQNTNKNIWKYFPNV